MTARMGVRSLQGEPFVNRLLHHRFYLSHVYEEYGVAMLTQHGIKCRIDRRKKSADIITESGLRIEIKSSGGRNGKSERSTRKLRNGDSGVYWDTFNICDSCRNMHEKLKQSDFFLFISEIGKCVFIVPTHDVELYGHRAWSISWTKKRLAGDYRGSAWRNADSTATILFRYRNAWHLLEQAERDRKDEQAKRTTP